MAEMVRAHVIFSGKVQGVFFRASAMEKAGSLELCGWVRNLPNGKVEMVAEGERRKVDRLIEWCTHEQPMARVTGCAVEWENAEGLTDLRIRG